MRTRRGLSQQDAASSIFSTPSAKTASPRKRSPNSTGGQRAGHLAPAGRGDGYVTLCTPNHTAQPSASTIPSSPPSPAPARPPSYRPPTSPAISPSRPWSRRSANRTQGRRARSLFVKNDTLPRQTLFNGKISAASAPSKTAPVASAAPATRPTSPSRPCSGTTSRYAIDPATHRIAETVEGTFKQSLRSSSPWPSPSTLRPRAHLRARRRGRATHLRPRPGLRRPLPLQDARRPRPAQAPPARPSIIARSLRPPITSAKWPRRPRRRPSRLSTA
jgi:hypothetical protein